MTEEEKEMHRQAYLTMARALRPDAQLFDEIRIVTVPRFKTSGLSGDEWRISARIDFYRKGTLVHQTATRNVEAACNQLGWLHASAGDHGGMFAGIGDTCDQEGCNEAATVVLRLKERYCVGGGNCGQRIPPYEGKQPEARAFCERHSQRGDSDLEDNDANYERVSDPDLVEAVLIQNRKPVRTPELEAVSP